MKLASGPGQQKLLAADMGQSDPSEPDDKSPEEVTPGTGLRHGPSSDGRKQNRDGRLKMAHAAWERFPSGTLVQVDGRRPSVLVYDIMVSGESTWDAPMTGRLTWAARCGIRAGEGRVTRRSDRSLGESRRCATDPGW
jgi:hypothetical protein